MIVKNLVWLRFLNEERGMMINRIWCCIWCKLFLWVIIWLGLFIIVLIGFFGILFLLNMKWILYFLGLLGVNDMLYCLGVVGFMLIGIFFMGFWYWIVSFFSFVLEVLILKEDGCFMVGLWVVFVGKKMKNNWVIKWFVE